MYNVGIWERQAILHTAHKKESMSSDAFPHVLYSYALLSLNSMRLD